MQVFHGSYKPVIKPDLKYCKKLGDFGRGFYLSRSFEHANKAGKRKGSGSAIVTVYDLDIESLNSVDCKDDLSYFIYLLYQHRYLNEDINDVLKRYDCGILDCIRGYTADSKDIGYIMDRLSVEIGNKDPRKYLEGLSNASLVDKTNKLKIHLYGEQICLKTEKALSCLRYKKTILGGVI